VCMGSLTNDGRFVRTDIWREGKWVDLWCSVHFLSGISIGIAAPVFNFPHVYTVGIVFLLLVAYELWEAMVKIDETVQNRSMDVVVGMASFLPVYFLTLEVPLVERLYWFALVFGANAALAAMGWYASHKADALEKRLKQRFAKRRERRLRKAAQLTASKQEVL
jgi:hypothetical protein